MICMYAQLKGGDFVYKSQEIAEQIRKEALNKNILLKDMFKDLGISVNTLSNMKRCMPSIETLAGIANYLGCSLEELIGLKEKAPTARKSLYTKLDRLSEKELEQFEKYLDFLLSQK